MNGDAAATLTGGAALSQGTGRTRLGWEMHDSPWLESQFHLIRTPDYLALPIQVKGRFGKASAIAHRPGFTVHLQVCRALPDQQTTQVGAIDVQFAHSDVLARQIRLDRLCDGGFRQHSQQ